jgi:glutamate dehydrogenase
MTEAPRWWVEGLRAALRAAGRPDGSCLELAETFASQVPTGYVERTEPGVAATDLIELGRLGTADGDRSDRMAVQPDPDPGAGMFRFRRYGRGAVELSSFVPILESFGLTVVEAIPHHIQSPDGGQVLHLDDFGLRARGRWPFDPDVDGPRLVAAVQAAWRAQAEVDSLNRLVVSAALDWRDVVVLRAYRRYRRQVGTPWTDRQLDDPLVEFPAVAVALLRYFEARFDPTTPVSPSSVEAARAAVLNCLASVERLEQDQVLRAYLGLVDATVRTSHYARTPAGDRLATLALKLDGARVPELPPPRPSVEAFVYAPVMEGIHLRGGPIARGGIRWSDRQDDLRTEVLGLVRAQVLKNAGIVPTGAKGGYVCKRLALPASDRGDVDVRAEVRECYRLFVSGLLDLTDNVVGGQVETPPGVRPADGEDSYLVVAADRGTASFSDLANDISAEHHFWLGDAFASGGHHGYDHKAMGITARGAWVAARQHFRQLGIDPEREEIRVIGVGDMSGDVFGNGMLQSRTIKLVAAFDHRHIFVDPDPDPARSYEARRRLFDTPGSTWQDYDRSALSPGGGVWSRTTKEIALSPEARAAVALSAASAGGGAGGGAGAAVSPVELVSAILTASADLLWLGGIGTFVKAPGESHADVGDRTNDGVRVNADQVRARVVAEGGNLGFTQRARIAYSRRGGKINADFIDNAAGVATSDYEVNLKILLALAREEGRITLEERDQLLAQVQEDVARAVLDDVGLTALAVTRAVPASAADLDAYEALMSDLEGQGHLDRKVEALPAGEDMAVRRAAGAGLTRPEAAVVLALAKSDLADALERSPLVADPAIHDAVTAYFPPAVVDRFGDLLARHRLYPQLSATRVAHEIVDRMGVTWAHETANELGVAVADVGRAYWAARKVIGAEARWREVAEMVPALPADAEDALDRSVAEAVDSVARRWLADGDGWAKVAEDHAIARQLEEAPSYPEPRAKDLVELGVGPVQAVAFARLPTVALAVDVGRVVRALGGAADVLTVLQAFDAFDAGVGMAPFRDALARLAVSSRWGRWQMRRLEDDLATVRRHAVVAALGSGGGGVAGWLAGRPGPTARFQRLAAHLRDPEADGSSLAALAVRALQDLVA